MNQFPPNQPPNQYAPQQQAGHNPHQNPYQPPHPGAQQPYFAPGFAPMHGGHEFGEAENRVIASAATWTMVLGVIYLLQAGNSFLNSHLVNTGLNLLVGGLFVHASTAFRKVVKTQGHDVPHLMSALQTFGNVLLIRIIGFAVVAVVAILGALAVIGFVASR